MEAKNLDCSFCKNRIHFFCSIYGADGEKAARSCADSGYRYLERKVSKGIRYKCIDSFQVRVCRNGIPTDDYMMIEKDSVWKVEEVSSDFIGSVALVKERTLEQLEITWGTLGLFFQKMEE